MTADSCALVQNPCLQFPLETGLTQWMAAQPSLSAEPSIVQPLLETLEGLTCNWMTLALAGTCGMGAIATTAFLHLGSVPPEPNCAALPASASERDHLTCVQRAIALHPTESLPWAMNWVRQWQPDHPLYAEGQQLLELWERQRSQPPLKFVTQFSAAAGTTDASPWPDRAVDRSVRESDPIAWKTQAIAPVTLYATAQTALQGQDWAGAFQALWQLQAWEQATGQGTLSVVLRQQIEAERQAQSQFNQALDAYFQGGEDDHREAIQRLQAINPTTYVGRSVPLWVSLWEQTDEFLPSQMPVSIVVPAAITPSPAADQPAGVLRPEGNHQPAFAVPFSENLSGDRIDPR